MSKRCAYALSVLLAAALAFAAPAHALPGDDQFLAHLHEPQTIHPPWPDSLLLENGHHVCFMVRKSGLTYEEARGWVEQEGDSLGTPLEYTTAGTFVHYALEDLCPV